MSERLERREGVVIHTLPDERQALADAERKVMLVVNPMGVAIWELLGEISTLDDLVVALSKAYKVPRGTVRRDVLAFLADLREHGFVLDGAE